MTLGLEGNNGHRMDGDEIGPGYFREVQWSIVTVESGT